MRIGIDYTAAVRQQAGIGRYTRELVSALLNLERGEQSGQGPHRYTLFAAAGGLPSGAWPSVAEADARIRTIPLSDDWLARLWQRARLPIPVELFTGPLDLFYSPDFVLPPTLPRTRTLLTVHDLSFLHYPEHFLPKLVSYLSRAVPRAVARADHVLADSASTRADLIAHLGAAPERVEVLYSGVQPRFQPAAEPGERERLEQRYGLDRRPYILSVGTIQPRKNYARLIRACARIETEALLVIAGGLGWLYEEVLFEAERHPDRTRILGFVDDADLPALYRCATLLACPSFYEGFGLPVLEAMACGTPVVCADTASLPEVAGEAALLVSPHDDEPWRVALERALVDETLRRDMVRRGLQQAAQFTWERAARQLRAAFDGLLDP